MDLDLMLHDTAVVPEPGEAALARGRATLDTAAALQAQRISTVVRARRRRPSRRAAVALSAVAAAAAALLLVPTIAVNGRAPSSAAAAEVLRIAGTAAGAQHGGWSAASYWHAVEQEQRNGGPVVRREIWLGHAKPGVLLDPLAGPGGDSYTRITPALFLTGITWDQLYQLPTGADELAAVLHQKAVACGCGPDVDSEIFDEATSALTESPASPALRQALWEVAARVSGARLLGPTTDAVGRRGTAIERDDETYVVDQSTGALLQWSGAARAGSSGSFRYTYMSQGPSETEPQVSGPVS